MTHLNGFSAYDVSAYLDSEEMIAAYLSEIIEEDLSLLPEALGDIAKAKGMSSLAKQTGLSRESLYRTLSANGNPTLSTLEKVTKAFNIKLSVESADSEKQTSGFLTGIDTSVEESSVQEYEIPMAITSTAGEISFGTMKSSVRVDEIADVGIHPLAYFQDNSVGEKGLVNA
jgi:probable addiction module antidote protein